MDASVHAGPHSVPGQDASFTEVIGEREFTGELIVRPRQDLAPADRGDALLELGAFPNRRNARTDEFVLALGGPPLEPGAAERAVAEALMSTGLFQYACPNWRVFPTIVPNDPLFAQQWHHAMIESAGAWDLWRADGMADVIVAVTDTGITVHEDLPFRVPGFNCVTNLPETAGGNVTDINGHGTHVAGCAAAAGNNAVGVSGPGWKLRVMPVRVSEQVGGGATYEDLLQGVQWAAENGAKVISTSYSGIGYAPIETTGQYVRSLGASMLWAAGNSDTDHAGWDFEHVIVVGASDQADHRAGFSSFGLGVDVFAPGVSILSTTRDGSYGFAHEHGYARCQRHTRDDPLGKSAYLGCACGACALPQLRPVGCRTQQRELRLGPHQCATCHRAGAECSRAAAASGAQRPCTCPCWRWSVD
jgi:subtilisin family serine protease